MPAASRLHSSLERRKGWAEQEAVCMARNRLFNTTDPAAENNNELFHY